MTGSRPRTLRPLVVLAAAVLAGACGPHHRPHRKLHLAVMPRIWKRGSLVVTRDGDRVAWVVRRLDGREYVVDAGTAGPAFEQCGGLTYVPERGLFYFGLAHDGDRPLVRLVGGGATVETGFEPPPRGEATIEAAKDGGHWIVAGRLAGEQQVVGVTVDGGVQRLYPDVSSPAFSPDGKHVALIVETDGGSTALVVDGETRRTFDRPVVDVSPLMKNGDAATRLSPHFLVRYLADGSLLALARDRDGWAVFHDDDRLASYVNNAWRGGSTAVGVGPYQAAAGILSTTLATAEHAPVAAWWERLAGEAERWRVVVGGKPADDVVCAAPFQSQPVLLSTDGRHVAYGCITGEPGREQARVVVDGRARSAPARSLWGLALTPDGAHVAYAASPRSQDPGDEGGWAFFLDDRRMSREPYDLVWRARPSDDGRHVAWEAGRGGPKARGVLAIDGHEVAGFDGVLWGPEFRERGFVSWVIRRGVRVTRIDVGLD